MIGESVCTVYKASGVGFRRFVLCGVHWQENKASNVLKSGLQNADSVVVYIPKGCAVISPYSGLFPSAEELFPSVDTAPSKPTKDFMVYGECDFEFDNTSEKTVSDCMRVLQSKATIHTVMSVDRKLYGCEDLQHIKVSAR